MARPVRNLAGCRNSDSREPGVLVRLERVEARSRVTGKMGGRRGARSSMSGMRKQEIYFGAGDKFCASENSEGLIREGRLGVKRLGGLEGDGCRVCRSSPRHLYSWFA